MFYTLLSLIITLCFDFITFYIFNALHSAYHEHILPSGTDAAINAYNNTMSPRNSIGPYGSTMPKQLTKAPMDSFALFFYIVLGIVSIAVFILIFHLLTRKTALYLQEITEVLEKISDGDFSARVPVRYNDEFSIIADNINLMVMDLEFLKKTEQQDEKRKNELITNVAHDLRTPLTSIIGYLDILNTHPELSEENRKKYTQIAYDKASRLQTLIEDLFSFTKITYGQMPLKLSNADLVKLIEQEVEEFYPSFSDNNLVCELKSDLERALVLIDGNLIARAFENLISNAIKYGRDGKVVRIYIQKKGTYVSVAITNYGIVIPKDELPLIFDKFYRVEHSRQETLGGTGLGLSIAKAIIDSHHGTISAHSSLDGTVFEVCLPLMN